MATDTIKIKLAVDRSRNRVLFADAGSDFVDVLLSFLTLPLSALQLSAGKSSPPGCLSSLCESVNHLRESKMLKVDACHGVLLCPRHLQEFKYAYVYSGYCVRSGLLHFFLCDSDVLYLRICRYQYHHGGASCVYYSDRFMNQPRLQVPRKKAKPRLQVQYQHCSCWGQVMGRLLHVYNKASVETSSSSCCFLKRKERFVISDDWVIKPASTSSTLSLLQRSGTDGVENGFEEVEVIVSWEQVVIVYVICY
jgi:hypothetical protein